MPDHNQYNASVYTTPAADSVADFLTTNHHIQSSLKYWIEKLCPSDPINILELGTGKRSDRWRTIASIPTNHNWHITLSDFTYAALPSQATLPNHPSFTFRLSKLDLLTDPFPEREFNLLLATYVFDSIWFPQDIYINQMHYPGGLIAKVHEAFTTCLNPNGVFISIDKSSNRIVPEYEHSGSARFKTENYELAVPALEKMSYNTTLMSLNDFVASAGLSVPLDLSDHSVLIVQK